MHSLYSLYSYLFPIKLLNFFSKNPFIYNTKTVRRQYKTTNPNIFKNMTSGFAHQNISIFSLLIQRILVNLVD